ncbi:uncharacterized protein LTHEOB_12736 [Lasiodiplodia theobromae]|uniref:Uncharacterized protein n=1 Tax=Lasiodiplodia theobromae TaxID=45133 RepID=A0A5N5CUJ2_9PEZI|nr:uncharacterized protein LTHEOB_12736 [Lasiodiplodia theobromae]KAB2569017.1 hypothetical protein DBV05_g12307 [Lasiodiplodia theobromae]KAF4535203.1 hypothetical protein LTHEOB_12736 [Lasiodiplodia theobromae]
MDNHPDHPSHDASAAAENKPIDSANTRRDYDSRALEAPQLYLEEPKYPATNTWTTTAPEAITSNDKEVSSSQQPPHATRHRRILGCTPTTFALLTLLIIILIGAAVGGGVGGHLATANQPTTTITSTVTANPDPTSHSPSSSPNTTTATATATLPFHFTLYASPSFTGSAQNVSAAGNVSLPWRARSYVWDQQGSGCCALFCREGRDVGYRCNDVTYQDDVSGGGVDGVAVQCGGNEDGGKAPPGVWCEGN